MQFEILNDSDNNNEENKISKSFDNTIENENIKISPIIGKSSLNENENQEY